MCSGIVGTSNSAASVGSVWGLPNSVEPLAASGVPQAGIDNADSSPQLNFYTSSSTLTTSSTCSSFYKSTRSLCCLPIHAIYLAPSSSPPSGRHALITGTYSQRDCRPHSREKYSSLRSGIHFGTTTTHPPPTNSATVPLRHRSSTEFSVQWLRASPRVDAPDQL
ncbi:hypothetical protein BO86DRAFT_239442 [Aspergillus japonicus CBS 114.51]|uniref:Uncharacterized protein n=1 Tax=Aspergillus japonicus CBS 114.51 TaxID=1448312 RepID=A0A8T8X800_ASPJA|nr:hypothetical protein BO86DRAFT_239442 [Aspergillus japonicus CBS 114.51]RAH84293.1 hypothetical protein BO86DRAFT_239442 [Aspergillus japonicus CBS 114.51]